MDQEASVNEVSVRDIQLLLAVLSVGVNSLGLCHLCALEKEVIALLQSHRMDRRVQVHEQIVVEGEHI